MRKVVLPAFLSALPQGVRHGLWLLLPLAPVMAQAVLSLRAPSAPVMLSPSVSAASEAEGSSALTDLRFELLASLDLFVRAEQVIQQETGSFTSALGRVPDILGPITAIYRIEVPRAARNRLLVTAEGAMSTDWVPLAVAQDIGRDRVTVDEQFILRANFPMPVPPAGYLRALAQTVMGRIQAEAASRIPEESRLRRWEGVFSGHFDYEIRGRAAGGAALVAVPRTDAARAASGGRDLQWDPESATIFPWMVTYRTQTFGDVAARSRLQEIYLAQKTHFVHTGKLAHGFDVLPGLWAGLRELHSSDSSVQLDGYALDSTYGYQAEVAVLGEGEQIRNLWSINGYGQTSRINPVEELMGRFEKATKTLEGGGVGAAGAVVGTHRSVSSDGPPTPVDAHAVPVPRQ